MKQEQRCGREEKRESAAKMSKNQFEVKVISEIFGLTIDEIDLKKIIFKKPFGKKTEWLFYVYFSSVEVTKLISGRLCRSISGN